jgi:hypothetical protein
MGKFSLLYFVTMGFYRWYWMYIQWDAAEKITGRPTVTLWRTLFAWFYVHELFTLVKTQQKSIEQQYPWRPMNLAWLYIGSGVFPFLVRLLVYKYEWSIWWSFIALCVALLVKFYVLYTAQLVINRVAGDPFGAANSHYTMQNHLWSAFGVYLWISTVYSIYLDSTGQLSEPPELSPPAVQTETRDPVI